MYHNEEIVALAYFSENVEINVVYYDTACAINSFLLITSILQLL